MQWDDAFSSFVQRHTETLYRSACVLTGDPTAAADLVQDTFVTLYPSWPKVAAADSALAYVRRSLVNRYLSGARRMAHAEWVTPDPPVGGAVPRDFHDLLERDALLRMLQTLPARQRAALVLRYLDDLDDRTGARVLDCPLPTYRSLVRRGLARLREAQPSGASPTAPLTALGGFDE